jgi:hypothetical protein
MSDLDPGGQPQSDGLALEEHEILAKYLHTAHNLASV